MATVWHFSLLTFGCKVNQYETQAIRELFVRAGGQETEDYTISDLVLLNTCAVTQNAVADARQAVYHLKRLVKTSHIVVTGCAAKSAELGRLGVSIFPQKTDILNLSKFFDQIDLHVDLSHVEKIQPTNQKSYPPFFITEFRRARPVLKVQDGCSQCCSYCIVPLTRGLPKSRIPQDCLEEAQRLLQAGYREIMISGINLRQYHAPEYGCDDFWDLLDFLDRSLATEWNSLARFRLSSLEPSQLNEKGLNCLEKTKLVCPHLHLSLQSGSPDILRAMHRNPIFLDHIVDRVQSCVKAMAHKGRFALGADILTGFPRETEAHFQETIELIQKLPLTYAHVFPFSSRPGTVAASLDNQIPIKVRQERAALIRSIIAEKRTEFWNISLNADSLQIAQQGDNTPNGVDECYIPCRFLSPPHGNPHDKSPHALISAHPVRIEKNTMVVESL